MRYPKVKRDANLVDPKDAGVWTNGRPDQVDPRSKSERREREKRVQVPRVKLKATGDTPRAIDRVPRRKTKSRIDQELGEMEREAMHFRPKPGRAVSTETEKRRLALCNQFMGGKALPQSGTLLASSTNIPLHLVTGKLTKGAMKSIEAAKQARAESRKEEEAKAKREFEREFEEVSNQVSVIQRRIEACQGKPNCMRSIGRLRQELSERIAEMQRIDQILQGL